MLIKGVPLMDMLGYGEEFEASEPSGTRTISSHSLTSLDSTIPLSPDHPLTHASPTLTPTRASFHRRTARMTMRAQPAISPGHSARVAEAMALSDSASVGGDELGDEDIEEDGEDESSDADDKRDRSKDEGPGLEERKESVPEQQGAERVSAFRQPTLDTWIDPEDGKVYTDIPAYALPVTPIQTPPSPEWLSGSLPVSPSSLLELHRSILYDNTQRLDALLPTLFTNIDRDVRELYNRSGARPVLALEAWAGHVDIRMTDMSRAMYDVYRLIHDMLVQQADMQRKLQEIRGRVTALEKERGRREQ
ncbi:hypothetical protein Tco_0780497 [Tanacetum coccineum]